MKKRNTSSKQKIQALLSQTNGLIKIEDAQEVLGISREKATHTLWRLAKAGWIKKLKVGLYRVVSLESSDPSLTDENPWIIADNLCSPCYIGGWTAANFWGLTDQLFLKTWVITTQPVHKKLQTVSRHEFFLKQIKQTHFFGTKTEWIDGNKVLISDPHKTVIDFLNFPDEYSAQSMVDIFKAYLKSEFKDLNLLQEYAQKSSNRTILKRLGFFLEWLVPEEKEFIEFCVNNISKGYSSLSTKSNCTQLVKKWNLKTLDNIQVIKNND